MKDLRLQAVIIAARPKTYQTSKKFTDTVMGRLRSTEIFTSHIRKMNVNKKETFRMKLRHLPKLAIVAIALGCLLVLSGAAYATYQLLWPKPLVEVSQSEKSVSGRDQVIVLTGECGDEKLATRYELKKNAPINADEIGQVVQAHCELGAIQTWADTTFPSNSKQMYSSHSGPFELVQVVTSMATTLQSKDSNAITFTGLTKYNQEDESFKLSNSVRYIVNGREAKAGDIAVGDTVAYVMSQKSLMTPRPDCTETSCGYSSNSTTKTLLAVVKLDMPLKYYDQLAWQSLAERTTCLGNPNDSCLTGYVGGIDVYYGTASVEDAQQMKEIQGVVTKLSGKTTTIQSSSGTLFTIILPYDAVSEYNNGRAKQYYNDQTVKLGSTLRISYIEPQSASNKTIKAEQLTGFMLQVEMISKGDRPQAY